MKKIITLLAAVSLIFGAVGIAMAQDCATCVEPGTINRACPEEQDQCASLPFDYENDDYFWIESTLVPNYCESLVKQDRRVLFPACDCDNFREGDTIDIRMEILVNGQTGDNGAYWAQTISSVGGIDLGTYSTQTAACDPNRDYDYNGSFIGPFDYLYYNSAGNLVTGGMPLTGSGVDCYNDDPREDRENRVVVIQPNASAINNDCLEHGYVITGTDDTENRSIWAIDIPWIRFDLNKVQAGDVVSVRICVAKATPREEGDQCSYDLVDLGGICGDTGCCCEFEVGTLGCCIDEEYNTLIYPYATEMNSVNWWYGMVITNLDSVAGEADVTVYETNADGSVDTATITVDVAANGLFVTNNQALMSAFGGDIGDGRAYFVVNTEFDASGFMFIGNDVKAEAMGYLPEAR